MVGQRSLRARISFFLAIASLAVVMTTVPAQANSMTTLTVSDAQVIERTGGTSSLSFVVQATGDITGAVYVDYQTFYGTAFAPLDFAHRSGVVELGYSNRSVTVAIAVVTDDIEEENETMTLELSNPRAASPYAPPVVIGDASGLGTILDDDAPGTRTLTIDDPGLTGHVSGPGIDCGFAPPATRTDCSEVYQDGTEVTLTASSLFGSFIGWGKDCSESNLATCRLTMSSDRAACAFFKHLYDNDCVPGFRLTISPPPGDNGMVTGPGIACGGSAVDCTEVYPARTDVTLTAIDNGYVAGMPRGWGGDCVGQNGTTCTISMTKARTACAAFETPQRTIVPGGCTIKHRITVSPAPQGHGTISAPGINCGLDMVGLVQNGCTALFEHGTRVDLTATSMTLLSGMTGWGGDCAVSGISNLCRLTIRSDRVVCAKFSYINFVASGPSGCTTSVLTIAPPPGFMGRITGPGINCGAVFTDCTEEYPTGQSVTITGFTGSGSFSAWGKDCAGQAGSSCTIVMTSDRVACGTFNGPTGIGPAGCVSARLTIDPAPGTFGHVSGPGIDCGRNAVGQVRMDCSEDFPPGATVVLTAPNAIGWNGVCSGVTSRSCTVTMNNDARVCASFLKGLVEGPLGCRVMQLTIDPAPGDFGKITGPGINCGQGKFDCSQPYIIGSSVTLTASGSPDKSSWGKDCKTSTPGTCTLQMSKARTACAGFSGYFAMAPSGPSECTGYTLTVDAPPGSWGYISGPGIKCGRATLQTFTDCTETFWDDEIITLTASGYSGATVSAWGQACTGNSGSTCQLKMDRTRVACATFSKVGVGTGPLGCTHFRLRVDPPPEGFGNVSAINLSCGQAAGPEGTDCDEIYPAGAQVYVNATPRPGVSTFFGWGKDCFGTNGSSCLLTMNRNRDVCATFDATGIAKGPTGCSSVVLTISPSDAFGVTGPGIDCGGSGTDCTEAYAPGTQVTLWGRDGGMATWVAWGGACGGSATLECTITMSTHRTVCQAWGHFPSNQSQNGCT